MPSVHEGYGLQLIDESRYVFRKHLLVGDEHFFVHDMVTGNTNQLTPETLFLNVLGGSKVSGVSVSNGFIYFLGTNAMEGRRLISLSISTPSSYSPEFITPIYRPYTNAQGQVFPGYLFSPGKQNSKGFIIHVHGGGCQQFHQTPYLYMYDPVRRALLDKGYSFYFITYSGDLQSPSNAQMDESCTSASLQRLSDVKAAIQSLRTSDSYAPIIVWGHSFGAYLVNLLATSSDQLGVTGFISQAGIWNTQIYPEHFTIPNEPNPLVSATQIKTPLLVAHGTRDESVSYSQLEEVQKFAKNAKVPVTFFSADGENHLFDADHSQIQKEWLESILHFFGSLNGSDGGA
jgi:dipeptidyl aminopeptidase/acylaminoacyl peptidase